ncbi:MAG: M18 family aminopeptidase [Spirochaetales bacterium]|nr:M18 family aminopeptidase [Spirochaetales bacterium]
MQDHVKKLAEDLASFIEASPSAFHAVSVLEERLKSRGFIALDEKEAWSLQRGGRYYVKRNGSSLAAFIPGKKPLWESGFHIAGAHTDSPSFRIKKEGASLQGGILRMSVETYGGPIISTWLDRNLSLAGRVVTAAGTVTVDLKDPVAIIMNQAIHMNRDMNKGVEYNKQTHLQAAFTIAEQGDERSPAELFKALVAEKAGLDADSILDMELFLYDVQKPLISGMRGEFISSSRIDNLAMCHSIVEAIGEAELQDHSSLAVFFDNEEIGSRTLQGADSSFLRDLLDRLTAVTGGKGDDSYRARALSFSISADGAHAHHPNYPESHDPAYAPKIGGGPVIKISSTYRYSTTAETAALFKKLCKSEDVPVQELINRSDIPSGSTIGTMTSALTGIASVDVGSPMFAMHSIRETAGVRDHEYMTRVLKRFYNCDLNSL